MSGLIKQDLNLVNGTLQTATLSEIQKELTTGRFQMLTYASMHCAQLTDCDEATVQLVLVTNIQTENSGTQTITRPLLRDVLQLNRGASVDFPLYSFALLPRYYLLENLGQVAGPVSHLIRADLWSESVDNVVDVTLSITLGVF